MVKQIQLRRGTTSEHATFTGKVGEVTIDTDKKTLVVHDNATAGGVPLAKASELPVAATDVTQGKVELATSAETQTGTDTARAVTPKGLADSAIYQGYHCIGYWPARALTIPKTNGAASLAKDESSTNKVNDEYLAFADGSTLYAGFSLKAPKSLDPAGALYLEIEWKEAAGASSHVCRWQVEAQAQGDGDTIDSAWGTAVAVDDTGSSGTRRQILTGSITPAGTWVVNDKLHFRVARLGGHANDTLNVAAHLIGVALYASINRKDDN